MVDFDKSSNLPWQHGEKARRNTRLFYQVVVGAIAMEEATAKLLEVYADEDIERVSASGFAPIAILTLDARGGPTEPHAVAISSFAWGLPLALRRELSGLERWPAVEAELVEAAEKIVRIADAQESTLPVDRAAIEKLYVHLVRSLGLPQDCVVTPGFAIRVYQWWKAEEPPEPPPMGSFFLGDLAKAKGMLEAGSVPALLKRYLGCSMPASRVDLLRDDAALADAVAPRRMAAGQWPTVGGHPLVLLQQAAVNLAIADDAESPLLPVNGPPGTGKTTLLRDLVVALVVKRACAMASFTDPKEAFTPSGQVFKLGNAFTRHYQISSSLAGYEIVVASTNNRAVENVSAELPALTAIDPRHVDLRYFATVARNVANGAGRPPGEVADTPNEASEAWGLIAAVLGNARNRFLFRQLAWKDEDWGLRTYLKEASGTPQKVDVKDPKTGRIVEERKPRIVLAERPPATPEVALKRWKSARKLFNEALVRVQGRMAVLEKGRRGLESDDLSRRRSDAESEHAAATSRLVSIRARRDALALEIRVLEGERGHHQTALSENQHRRPGVVGRMFSSHSMADWTEQHNALTRRCDDVRKRLSAAQLALSTAKQEEAACERGLAAATATASGAAAAAKGRDADLEAALALSGNRFVDAAFFERGAGDLQRDTPWLDEEALRLREAVFVAAMALHRAFVDCAAKQVRNNLDLLFRWFFGNSAWTERVRPLMPSLWTTFFSVVPVVSTTFASVERMFGYLDPGALGWLLVDEAGQATPQAAVGAMMRARRGIVVGDPMQLPPVTMLPTELAHRIAAEFKVDHERFVAPAASVQILADSSSLHGTTLNSDGESVRVGVPLLVHRRCAEPMFSLSNDLAYGGMMVQGRGERRSSIRDVLGPSAWIDVKPDRCEDKWSVAEGRAVLEMLRRLDRVGLEEIDLYLISPFRIVAQKLRELLVTEGVLARWTDKPRDWVKERIGTVYTVQGREADTVIMVLGAAEPQRRGARGWAGQDVNQLNVAVTRAKENLYVVGNRFEWASAGKFARLERALP